MEAALEREIRQIVRDERIKERAEEREALKGLTEVLYKGVVPGGDGAL